MSLVDTHCHLDLEAFADDRGDVLRRALGNGVHAMLLIGYNPERWESTLDLCRSHHYLTRAVGLHPNDAEMWDACLEQRLRDHVAETSPIAIGEIGLDFYRSSDTRDMQLEAFVRQMEMAQEVDLPVIIHQRSAESDVLQVLERFSPVRGVMHCFTGDSDFASQCINLGMHLGIGGVATFKKSDDLRAAIAAAPDDRILLETDAPFLAPQTHRGKRNEPSYVTHVAQSLSEHTGKTVSDIAEQTTANAVALFGHDLETAIQAGMESS